MKRFSEKKIFADCGAGEFTGRAAEFERLLRHARSEGNGHGLILLSTPNAGSTELLRQVYDHLFFDHADVIPFYFEIRASDETALGAALRFLREFLLQTVAFRRNDIKILDSSPEICEIAELAVPADGYWIDRLVETCHSDSKLNDDRSFIRNCLSAPLRAAGHAARSFVMIDSLHAACQLVGGDLLIDDLRDIFGRSSVPFVFAGYRRFLFAKMPFETMPVEPLSFADGGALATRLSAKTSVAINDQTRDLIAVQLAGNVGLITSLFASAAEKGDALDSFERVEQSYTDEIFGGRIARYFDAIFDRILPDPELQNRVLRLLTESMNAIDGKIPLGYWKKHAGLNGAQFDAMLDGLNCHEIISIESGAVRLDSTDGVLGDYIRGRIQLEVNGVTRALVIGETLAANLKRAPDLMARFYRGRAAIGLRKLLQAFDGRQVSSALIDYGRFRAELKGANDEKILKALKEDNEKINLPQIVYTAHAAAFYPELGELIDAERSAVAFGFDGSGEKNQIVWIAAEINSKLEATGDLAEFWCDRLEMVAVHCNFSRFRLWLVAPEGFTPDALTVLRERNAFGSSRKQAELLAGILNAKISIPSEPTANEYEIVVPMGEDTEMISAHAIEDIAKRHGFPAKTINQIKTALVEACINAAEHSLSPDRKIYQKFIVTDEKIVITVANRGVRLAHKTAFEIVPDEGRRGWGLKLMKGLMDDVKIEETDDGTRITMTKFIKSA